MKYLLIGFMLAMGMATPATTHAQNVPVIEDGDWSMPTQGGLINPEQTYSGESYESMIYEVCANEGCIVSPETMIRVMYCESGGNHGAVGPNGELGIMQIDPTYWSAAYGTPYQQIQFAAANLGGSVYWDCL